MSTRISRAVLLALLLAACEKEAPPPPVIANVDEQVAAAAEDDGRVLCAVGRVADFARACTIERHLDAAGTLLILRLPDGGFYRLRASGGVIAAADGAVPAVVREVAPGLIEVAIDEARFRLPASIAGT